MKFTSDVAAAEALKESYEKLRLEIGKVIVGQDETVRLLLTAIFCQGHCLLVGVPGLAKTLLIQTIANALDLSFNRIQFTPDLMPSDILGSETLDNERNFRFIRGPVFANIILADEINRTPPKTQSALLEAMQEYAVTVAGQKHALSRPFFVLATQNPIEQEGTYPLPEAQVDRFMLKIKITYPTREEELVIMRQNLFQDSIELKKIVSKAQVLKGRQLLKEVYLDEKIERYILDLVFATRNPGQFKLDKLKDLIGYGASPRATINLAMAARGMALLRRRGYVVPDDVRSIAQDVLRHRIAVSYEAEAEEITSEYIIKEILNRIEVP